MKSSIVFFALVLFSFRTFAANECKNKAKYYAINTYHAETGVVQGSNGISYQAEFLSEKKGIQKYQVKIEDNNEDGDYWTIEYEVTIDNASGACLKKRIKKLISYN